MNDKVRSMMIGSFVVSAVVLLCGALLFLKPSFGDGKRLFKVRFANIEKIHVGTRVTLAGKPIGQVVGIEPVADARSDSSSTGEVYAYELHLQVDSKSPIYYSDLVLPQTLGLLGEKTVAIIPQKSQEPLREVENGGLVFAQISPSVEEAVERFGRLAGKAENTLDSISHILKKGDLEMRSSLNSVGLASDALKQVLAQASEQGTAQFLAEAAKSTSKTMNSGEQLLQKIDESQILEELRGFLHHTRHIVEAIDQPHRLSDLLTQTQQAMGQLHRLGLQANRTWPKLEQAIDQLAHSANQIDSLSSSGLRTLEKIEAVAEHTYSGQGTLGRLLMKEELFIDINQLVARVNILLSDINNYGLLFHNNRTWKRQRAYQMDQLMALNRPEAFERYWRDQLNTIHLHMGHLSALVKRAGQPRSSSRALYNDPEFKEAFKQAVRQLNDIKEQLLLFEQNLGEASPPPS